MRSLFFRLLTRKNFLILLMTFIWIWKEAHACSISVNDNFQKNLLAAYGASHLNISFNNISKTTIGSYSRTMEEEDPSTMCPQYLRTQATISFKYSPSKFQNCDATVIVNRRSFIGEELEGLFETVSYSGLTSACSTTLLPIPGRIIRP